MGRAAYFGRELCKRDGEIYGINFGFGAYFEHEIGVLELINRLNETEDKKAYKNGFKPSKKYVHTPFYNCIIRSNIPLIKHDITIDNSKYGLKSLIASGKYRYYRLSAPIFLSRNGVDGIDGRKTYDESAFWNMGDLSSIIKFSGLLQLNYGAAWDCQNGAHILIRRDWTGHEDLADQFEISLRNGALALFDGHAGLFNLNGLSFAFLDRIYG